MEVNRIIIVGAGPAGHNAAKAAAQGQSEVHLYGNEDYLPYWRPQLPKIVASGAAAETIAIKDASWYEEQGITFHPGKTLVAVDPSLKEVIWQDGERTAYDRLILALGASSFMPDIGYGGQIMSLRSYDDALAIRACVLEKRKATVIGGGLLGLELAMEIRGMGASVTVLERAPWLMPRQLDETAGRFLQRKLTEQGLEIRTAVNAGEHPEILDGTCVIMAAGIRSNISVARDLGLEIGRAVVVNERMETSEADIYACGDMAEFNGRAWGLMTVANSQGAVAGQCACSGTGSYKEILPSPMLKIAGMNIVSVGDVSEEAEAQWFRYEDRDTFKAFKVKEGKLVAAIIFNDMKLSMSAKAFIDGRKTLSGDFTFDGIVNHLK